MDTANPASASASLVGTSARGLTAARSLEPRSRPTRTPTPDPRFHDNGDGTITDNQTGLMWEKDG
jgi:hypothetical protein